MKNRFSREDRSGLFFLGLLILCFIGSRILTNRSIPSDSYGFVQLAELAVPLESKESANPKQGLFFPFDPNTTPDDSIRMLAIPAKLAETIIRYRSKGGKFRKPEDLRKIYGMEDHFELLLPHIQLNHLNEELKPAQQLIPDDSKPDSQVPESGIAKQVAEDFVPGTDTIQLTVKSESADKGEIKIAEKPKEEIKAATRIELNGASQYELMTVKGIGPYYSRLITSYRDKIGGFMDVQQILEISGIQRDRAEAWLDQLYVDESLIRKMDLNAASFKQLAGLPVIGYKKAEIVKLFQKNNGDYKSVNDLVQVGVFEKEDIQFLSHYLVVYQAE